MSDVAVERVGRWGDLVAPGRRGPVVVLAAGVLLFAVDTYITSSLLPSVVREIGGESFYAWVATVFLLTATVASVLVGRVLALTSARRAYLAAVAVFGLGTAVDALSPSMAVLLVGRAIQGVGGGLLAAMAYALIRATLPRATWTRASAVISMMWGVGLLIGPAVGGVFAEIGQWRWAFVALVVATAVVAAGVPLALPHRGRSDVPVGRFPLVSVLLVGGAAAVLSVAGLVDDVAVAGGAVAVALALLAAFVAHERRTDAGVLPAATFRPGSALRAIYLTASVLVGASAVEAFVPLFGQRLGGVSPLVAGFVGAVFSAGWVVGEIPSAGLTRRAGGAVVLGPLAVVVGLGLTAATQVAGPNLLALALWVLGLGLAGAGVGVAWPHLAAAAMAAGDTEGSDGGAEADRASGAITVIQTLAIALGAALAGLAVGLGSPDEVLAARLLYGGMAVTAVTAVLGALPARRGILGTATRPVAGDDS